jgi:hypothetical protein
LLCGGKNPQPLDPIDLGPLVAPPNLTALADGANATYWDFKATSTGNPSVLAPSPADSDLRARVILPPMTAAQVASGRATLPMLVWVNGAYQPVLDTTFLSEMALLATASGYAIACLYVVTATGAERANDVTVKRKMSILDTFIRVTEGADILLRQGPKSMKLRRQGRAVVGGWSRGAEAAIRTCATGPAGGKLPVSLRPKAFIAIAPSAFKDKDSNKSFTLDETSGLAIFSYSDTDTELEMLPFLGRAATRATALVTLTFDCTDHNAYLANGFELPGSLPEVTNLAWGASSPPPCFLASSSSATGKPVPPFASANPRRRAMFRSWGSLANTLLEAQSGKSGVWNEVLRRGLAELKTELTQACVATIRAGRQLVPTTRRLLIDGSAAPSTSELPGFIPASLVDELTVWPFSKPGFSTPELLPNPQRAAPSEPKFLRFYEDKSLCAAFRADPGRNYVIELRVGSVPLHGVNFDIMSVTPFLSGTPNAMDLAQPAQANPDLMPAPKAGEISRSNYALCVECTSASGEVVTYASTLRRSGPVFNFKNSQSIISFNDTATVPDTICVPLPLGRNGPKSWVKFRIGIRTSSASCFVVTNVMQAVS